jgi:nucleoside-diphosphate-sugar epimerase
MKYLVTGGAGFIGSHIAENLVRLGREVVILDDLSTGKLENLKAFENDVRFIEGDVRDYSRVKEASEGVDVVFHEAAVASVTRSVEDPIETDSINVGGTVTVLQAAKENRVKKVVFASSAAIYGDDPSLPKTENMTPMPLSPYAFHKLAGEYYCNLFHQLYGLSCVALRYFNVFGPRQDPSSPYSGVISIFMDRFKKDLEYTIFGDGAQSRDFIYVDDIVRANLAAAKSSFDHVPIINAACNRSNTLLDLTRALKEISESDREPKFGTERVGDIKHSLADNSRLRTLLKVNPEVSFADGLRQLWDYA